MWRNGRGIKVGGASAMWAADREPHGMGGKFDMTSADAARAFEVTVAHGRGVYARRGGALE